MPGEIVVEIKPSIITHHLRSIMNEFENQKVFTAQDKAKFYFELINSIEYLEHRLLKYIRMVKEFFMNRMWTTEFLQDIGETILKYALENASEGYKALPKGMTAEGQTSESFKKRKEIVEKLYELRLGYVPQGLTAGADKLLASLRKGDQDNIFNVKTPQDENSYVEVGTKWMYAKLIEEGGINPQRGAEDYAKHLGMNEFGEPAKWLIDALGGDEDQAKKIVDELKQLIKDEKIEFPPRPYLKPALWYVRYQNDWVKMLIDIIDYGLKYSAISEISSPSLQGDSINVSWSTH